MSERWASLSDVAELRMGETIIASDCDGRGLPVYSADTSDSPWAYSTKTSRKLQTGTIVIGARGSIGFPRMPLGPFSSTQTTIVVIPERHSINPRYLLWALRRFDFRSVALQQAVPMLTVGDFSRAQVQLLPIVEQTKVAQILDTLDTQIHQTEALIAKLETVKQGLLTDLLTRGIDEKGQLRPPPEEAPELYKDSPLGKIPRSWGIRALRDCVRTDAPITYGIVQAGPDVEDGVPYIRTGDMGEHSFFLDGMLRTSPRIARQFERSRVRTGEIVCALRGAVGKVLEVPAELNGANLTQGTARISPAAEIDGPFMLWSLRSAAVTKQIAATQKGTTFQEITLGQLQGLQIARPGSFEEQQTISLRLKLLERRAGDERKVANELRALKAGLMDDLLTGRVRVMPLLGTAKTSETTHP